MLGNLHVVFVQLLQLAQPNLAPRHRRSRRARFSYGTGRPSPWMKWGLISYSYGHLPVITGYKWDYTFYKWGYI